MEKEADVQRRGSKVVDAVLEATVEELARVGFAALSYEAVAERAGVNKTTVYRRWPEKSELVRAAMRGHMSRNIGVPDTGNVRDDLVALLSGARKVMKSPLGRSLFLAFAAGAIDMGVAKIANDMRCNEELGPRQVISRAMARGELPKNANVEVLLDAMVGALQHRLHVQNAVVDDAYLRDLVDMVLAGARAVAEAKPPKARVRAAR